jgi:serine/threonine protein kinase
VQVRLLRRAADVAAGVSYLHSRNVCHGDLKCENVLLRSEPQDPDGAMAKVADFGLSRALAFGQVGGVDFGQCACSWFVIGSRCGTAALWQMLASRGLFVNHQCSLLCLPAAASDAQPHLTLLLPLLLPAAEPPVHASLRHSHTHASRGEWQQRISQ